MVAQGEADEDSWNTGWFGKMGEQHPARLPQYMTTAGVHCIGRYVLSKVCRAQRRTLYCVHSGKQRTRRHHALAL